MRMKEKKRIGFGIGQSACWEEGKFDFRKRGGGNESGKLPSWVKIGGWKKGKGPPSFGGSERGMPAGLKHYRPSKGNVESSKGV